MAAVAAGPEWGGLVAAGNTPNAGNCSNTGGGGGGGNNAGSGGSGVVVIQYAYNAMATTGTVTLGGGSIDVQSASTLDAFGFGGLLIVADAMATSTGTGGITIASSGSAGGVVQYNSASNTYAGDTTVNGGTPTLRMGIANAMPNGSGQGNLFLNGVASGSSPFLDLNGFNTAINGLNGVGNTHPERGHQQQHRHGCHA